MHRVCFSKAAFFPRAAHLLWVGLFGSMLFLGLGPISAAPEPSPQGADSPATSGNPRANDGDVSEYAGKTVTLSLRDADLVEVLRSFARLGEINLLLDPSIKGSVTMELKDVPWDQAMATVLKLNGLGMDISGNTVRVGPPQALQNWIQNDLDAPPPTPLIPTRRVRGTTKHLDVRLLARMLQKTGNPWMTSHGEVELDLKGSLTLEDTRSRINSLTRMIAALDRPGSEVWSQAELEQQAQSWWRKNVGTGGF